METKKKIKELTPKQKSFCEHYLANGMNATQACKDAGYSVKSAMEQGYQLLQNTSVQAFLATKKEKTATKLEITKESLIGDLLAIKAMCMADTRSMNNSIKAIETINKMLGYNAVDKKEIEHKGGIIWNEERTYSNEEGGSFEADN